MEKFRTQPKIPQEEPIAEPEIVHRVLDAEVKGRIPRSFCVF